MIHKFLILVPEVLLECDQLSTNQAFVKVDEINEAVRNVIFSSIIFKHDIESVVEMMQWTFRNM